MSNKLTDDGTIEEKYERGNRAKAGIYEDAWQDSYCYTDNDNDLEKYGIITRVNDQYRHVYEIMRDVAKLLHFQRDHMNPKEFEIFKYSIMLTLVGIRYCNEFM